MDVAIHSLYLDVPQGGADCLGIRLAGGLDGGDGDVDAVITAEAFGQTAYMVAALLPLIHVALRSVRVLCHLGEPRREGYRMERAVGGIARLLDQLVRRIRTTAGDDLNLELLLLGLLQNQGELLHRCRYEQCVAAGSPDLRKL